MMKLSQVDPKLLNCSLVHRILFSIPEDDFERGDCIFVFGSRKDFRKRMDQAIQLYRCHRAHKMLLSGGYGQGGVEKEALIMKKYAILNGVLEQDILIEDQSNNTTENVLCSLLVLHRAGLLSKIRRLLIVSSATHIKRCMLTLSRYMPRWIQYSYCYNHNNIYGHGDWVNNISVKKKLFEEVRNMIRYAKEGIIDDIEI